ILIASRSLVIEPLDPAVWVAWDWRRCALRRLSPALQRQASTKSLLAAPNAATPLPTPRSRSVPPIDARSRRTKSRLSALADFGARSRADAGGPDSAPPPRPHDVR